VLPDLDLWEGVVRLFAAAALAGLIGLERESAEQEAGLRTHILVSVGACLFMIVGIYAWHPFHFSQQIGAVVDPSRVASYVVAGVGFLGGGAIIRQGFNVRGLTTAASIWVVAAIGVAVGAGMYAFAVATTGVVILSLWPLKELANQFGLRGGATRQLMIALEAGGDVAPVLAALRSHELQVNSLRIDDEGERRQVEVVVAGRRRDATEIAQELADLEHVVSVQWAA
jgi:putative Mg2+ transporter-C (MgtC) family protein